MITTSNNTHKPLITPYPDDTYYSKITYPGNGYTRFFSVPFPYISKSHVHAFIDGSETSFDWISDGTLRITDSPPPEGSIIEIRRITPRSHRLTEHQDNVVLTAHALNLQDIQFLYLLQEDMDVLREIINAINAIDERLSHCEEEIAALRQEMDEFMERMREVETWFIDQVTQMKAWMNTRLAYIEAWIMAHGGNDWEDEPSVNYYNILAQLGKHSASIIENSDTIARTNDKRRHQIAEITGVPFP